MTAPRLIQALSGPALRDMFAAATTWLDQNKDQVNAINVFPVPDGDTGTNMTLTMRSTIEEAGRCEDESAGGMMAAMSHGALMGARGNSGVILSQILRGVARSMEGSADVDAGGLAASFAEGSAAAYKAVTKPAEGTILTVIREVSEATADHPNGVDGDILALMEGAVVAARESVARTPTLLPVLAEAGVVDAGGQGLYVILEGMLKHLKGEPMDAPASANTNVEHQWLSGVEQRHHTEASPYGYCAEVLVEGNDINVDTLREQIMTLGDSVIVVGDETLVRIHVHTDDPGAVLSKGTAVGSLAQVKIDNINRQAERFVQLHADDGPPLPPPETGAISYVAVASGEGLAEVFRSVGCSEVVSGGPTMNPSTREILAAVDACPTDDVVVLPNDKNIILAAEQAAPLATKRVHVVKSRSVPQGLAAILATNPEDDVAETVRAMDNALGGVRTVEITRAVRSTSFHGITVREGQIIAVVDDELKLAAESAEEAVAAALRDLVTDTTAIIGLYYGAETTEADAQGLAARLRATFAGHEVEVVNGGQPHYQYIVSLE